MITKHFNRKLLVSVFSAQEAREALLGGARIVDSEDPRTALGNIKPRQIMDIADAVLDFSRDQEVQLSTNIGEDQLLFDRGEDGRAIERSPYEIAGKAAQAAIGVAASMGARVHPVGIVKVGLDGMQIDVLREVLAEIKSTLDRTEQYCHSQVMSVLFAQNLETWEERRRSPEVVRQLIEIGEYQPTSPDDPLAVDLKTYAAGMTRRDGQPYFKPGEVVTLDALIAKRLLPQGARATSVKTNDLFPHHVFFPELASGEKGRTTQAVIKAMVDATADAGGDSIMIDTSILSKVARICLVDTAGSEIVDLNRFDVSGTGVPTQGILPLEDLKFFVDYCHYRGVAANAAGSLQSFQAQQLWVLLPELDQASTRGGASVAPWNPAGKQNGAESRHQKVIKRHAVRGLTAPEHGGVLNIPEAWSDNAEAMASVKEAAKMIADKRKVLKLPDLECYFVDKFGNPRRFNPL